MSYTLGDFEMSVQHVAEAERHVADQQRLVAHLESEGLPTKEARELLELFRATLASHREHKVQIHDDLESRLR